ncbi:MAG: type II toxin-antitoxin system RelE/ParE family toxin [Candidatus Tectomicrobia bacterium]|uniref:Type II toxin-antitoxin system RelE/ParE family toxin n=1 Tax=Tectimicrobiota bacterium TaxID=2528274 RepID=A0A932HVI4_UNCTE|nr:type II toxin-antitoxin system RelE/ParE family toxin [Candidatus Tectomicrobia bacterium]
MAREIVWTQAARRDLESVAEYIARDSMAYASTFVQEVIHASRSLADFADRGQIVSEFDDETLRELLIRSYRLIYLVADDKVLVLSLIHGARRKNR